MSIKPVDLLKTSILAEDEFLRVCPMLADLIKQSKMTACKEVITLIKKIIKSKQYPPPQKTRALKVLNACMIVGNVNFLMFAQKKIMSRLEILATYKKELTLEQRAESLFGKESAKSLENKTASIEFLKLLLEYIRL